MARIRETSVPPLDDPFKISSVVNHYNIVFYVFGTRDGVFRDIGNNIPVLYSSVLCVYVKPAQLTLSTAPPLPCETHTAQRLCPTITLVGRLIEGFWTRASKAIVVFVIFVIRGFWNNKRRAELRGRRVTR